MQQLFSRGSAVVSVIAGTFVAGAFALNGQRSDSGASTSADPVPRSTPAGQCCEECEGSCELLVECGGGSCRLLLECRGDRCVVVSCQGDGDGAECRNGSALAASCGECADGCTVIGECSNGRRCSVRLECQDGDCVVVSCVPIDDAAEASCQDAPCCTATKAGCAQDS